MGIGVVAGSHDSRSFEPWLSSMAQLVLASAVFLGTKSLGTGDHILLSQIRDFFSSPPTTRRVTVEVFDPASTHMTPPPSQSQSYITTDGQSASLFWNKAPIRSLRADLYYCMTFAGLLKWGALSDERTGLSIASSPNYKRILVIENRIRPHRKHVSYQNACSLARYPELGMAQTT
jgi:hypothetical protein